MILYLVRHGEATDESVNPECPLTEKGKQEVLKVAQHLKQIKKITLDKVWHSKKTRAAQTAQLITEIFEKKEICEATEGLNPNDPVEPILDKIREIAFESDTEKFMLVGHLPFLNILATFLLDRSSPTKHIQIPPAGVVCFEEKEPQKWELKWEVIPDLLS